MESSKVYSEGGANHRVTIMSGALLLAICVGALGWYVNRANQARVAAMEKKLAQLELAQREPHSEVPARASLALERPQSLPEPALPQPRAVAARAPDPASSEGANPPAPTPEDTAAYVESVYSAQKYDPKWAREAQQSIGAALRQRLGNSRLESMDCRETLCRARLSHANAEEFSGFIDRMLADSRTLWTGPVSSYRDPVGPNGQVTNSIYFAKEGTTVPQLGN